MMCDKLVQRLVMSALLGLFLPSLAPLGAQQAEPPTENDYYQISALPIPAGVVLEASALEMMPDGQLAVASRRGDLFLVENPLSPSPDSIKFSLYASGLHEVLGLANRGKDLFVTQRCEVTRLVDTNRDMLADLFETVSDGWGINGDYHEYAFGSRHDKDGNIWVVLCLTGSFNSNNKYRGWCLRITPDGEVIPTCSGIRSPGGIGMNIDGDVFYTDNQGPWNGTCSLKHLRVGSFQGHPAGNRWYDQTDAIGPRPSDPQSGSRIMTEADKIPQLEPAAVLFPYKKMGQSASGIACDRTAGKFGPFAGQLFVGDQTFSTVMRVYLEKVQGHYQGACFPFRSGFGSGSLSVMIEADGAMFVGGTNRGWGSRGSKPFALERLNWTGKVPFEIHEMHARPDGFELTFTHQLDASSASDPASYTIGSYAYIYQSNYGSPEVDHTTPRITEVKLGKDGRSVRLLIDKLQRGHVHELHAAGVRSAAGLPLLHDAAYYTLNYIPAP
jgi:hypothetical protein